MDAIEQARGVLGLVGLELADEVKLGLGKSLAQRGPLVCGFLHAVLAEPAMARFQQRCDCLGRVSLADGYQAYLGRLAPGNGADARDAVVDFLEAQLCIHDRARYNPAMSLRQTLPNLWLLSDARNDELLPRALRSLPRGSAFVYRHYHLDPRSRRARFDELMPLVADGGHLLILSGSDDEARAWGAAGSYGPPEAVGDAPELMRVAAVHDAHEIAHANAAAADAAMLSPVFATRTHPNAVPLGAERFHALAALAEMPVIALGGMTFERAKELGWSRWAAIDGLALKQPS